MESLLQDEVIVQCQVLGFFLFLFFVGHWLIGVFPGQESWIIILVMIYFVALDKLFTLLSDSEESFLFQI